MLNNLKLYSSIVVPFIELKVGTHYHTISVYKSKENNKHEITRKIMTTVMKNQHFSL